MNTRTIIPLVVGLGVGIVAIKMFISVLKKAKGETDANTVLVVRAGADIEATSEIEASMLEVTSVPKSLAPDDFFKESKEVVGRVTSRFIPKGVPVMPTLLAPKGTPPGMAARIDKGSRAVAVKIDEYSGVAGWIKPGSHVDVVVVMAQGRSGSTSKVILQNVKVLAVGQKDKSEDNKASLARSVTLLISPKDVPLLHLAAAKGKLRLAMRGKDDSSKAVANLTTDNDLLSSGTAEKHNPEQNKDSLFGQLLSKEPKIASNKADKELDVFSTPKPAPPTGWTVEVMSGSESYQVMFEDNTRHAQRLNSSGSRSGGTKGSPTADRGDLSDIGRAGKAAGST